MIQASNTIRILTPADADAAARLHRLSLEEAWSAPDWARYSAEASVVALGSVTEDSGLAGVLLIRIVAGEAELLTIAVHAAQRGRGIGSRLLTAGLADARTRGAECVHLEVAADNSAALRLYQRAGFRQCGCRPEYYRRAGGRIDATLMRLTIGNPEAGGSNPGRSESEPPDPVSIRTKKH